MRHHRIVSLRTEAGETVPVSEQRHPATSYGRPFMTQFLDIIPTVARAIDSAVELKVLLTLPLHLSWTEFRRLDQAKLAKAVNAGQSSVSKAMVHLHELGIVERQGRGPVTLWKLSDEWGWKGSVDQDHASRRKGGKPAPSGQAAPLSIAAEGISRKAAQHAAPKREQRNLRLLSPLKSSHPA